MADLSIFAGATSQSILVDLYILATGAAQTGLVFNSSGLTAYYSFAGASATATSITLATLSLVTSAYSSGGFIELDATHMPGIYRFDLPNAVIASAKGREVIITFTGFSGMATRHIKLELTAVDNQSTAFGLSLAKTTNITGFNDIAASAIVSSGAITTSGGAVSTVTTVTNQLTAAAIATGVWQDSTAGDFTTASSIGKCLYIANVAPGASGGHFISGSNSGTTTVGALTITGATTHTGNVLMSAGLTVNQSSSNASAIVITGNGTGHGIISTSGSGITGDGIKAVSAATNGNGMTLTKTGTGSDLNATVTPLTLAKTTNITGFNDIAAPTGFAAATFPSGTIANTTNITAGTITTVTTLTNAPSDSSGVTTLLGRLTSTRAGYLDNLSAGAVALASGVTVSTNNDKTGYSLTQSFPSNFSSLGISASGHISNVDTLTTYTGNTVQTGDSFARLGAPVGASTSADIASVQADTTAIRTKYKKNTAHAKFQFTMQDSTTGADKTGLTVAGQVNIDGAGFVNLTNSISELANGWYTVDLASGDLNGTNIALQFKATGAITKDIVIVTQV